MGIHLAAHPIKLGLKNVPVDKKPLYDNAQINSHRVTPASLLRVPTVVEEFERRAKRIKQQKGTLALLKGIVSFMMYPVYKNTHYFLYGIKLKPDDALFSRFLNIDQERLTFRVVNSILEAEALEKEGLSFRDYPTELNPYQKQYSEWLDRGAIAFCTFVDKEFGAICWAIPSREVQKAVNALPMKVDYENHEVIVRGMWVNPKFRGMELFRFTAVNRNKSLMDKGVTTIKGTIDVSNRIGKGVVEALGETQYGRAIATKLLWFKFWREYHRGDF